MYRNPRAPNTDPSAASSARAGASARRTTPRALWHPQSSPSLHLSFCKSAPGAAPGPNPRLQVRTLPRASSQLPQNRIPRSFLLNSHFSAPFPLHFFFFVAKPLSPSSLSRGATNKRSPRSSSFKTFLATEPSSSPSSSFPGGGRLPFGPGSCQAGARRRGRPGTYRGAARGSKSPRGPIEIRAGAAAAGAEASRSRSGAAGPGSGRPRRGWRDAGCAARGCG